MDVETSLMYAHTSVHSSSSASRAISWNHRKNSSAGQGLLSINIFKLNTMFVLFCVCMCACISLYFGLFFFFLFPQAVSVATLQSKLDESVSKSDNLQAQVTSLQVGVVHVTCVCVSGNGMVCINLRR